MSVIKVTRILYATHNKNIRIFDKHKRTKKSYYQINVFGYDRVFKWKCKLLRMMLRIRKVRVAVWSDQISFHITMKTETKQNKTTQKKRRIALKC